MTASRCYRSCVGKCAGWTAGVADPASASDTPVRKGSRHSSALVRNAPCGAPLCSPDVDPWSMRLPGALLRLARFTGPALRDNASPSRQRGGDRTGAWSPWGRVDPAPGPRSPFERTGRTNQERPAPSDRHTEVSYLSASFRRPERATTRKAIPVTAKAPPAPATAEAALMPSSFPAVD